VDCKCFTNENDDQINNAFFGTANAKIGNFFGHSGDLVDKRTAS